MIEFLNNNKSHADYTLLNRKLRLFPEPVDKWRDLNGANLLELMYKDPVRWAFAFHSYIQLTMLENHLKINQIDENSSDISINHGFYPINIMERSIFSARYCFLENFFQS